MKKYIKQNGITYELRGEQYYPMLELPEQKEIGKWGLLRLGYLKRFAVSLPFLIYWVLHHVAPVFLQKTKENVYR